MYISVDHRSRLQEEKDEKEGGRGGRGLFKAKAVKDMDAQRDCATPEEGGGPMIL
jgi:hypothetical protein